MDSPAPAPYRPVSGGQPLVPPRPQASRSAGVPRPVGGGCACSSPCVGHGSLHRAGQPVDCSHRWSNTSTAQAHHLGRGPDMVVMEGSPLGRSRHRSPWSITSPTSSPRSLSLSFSPAGPEKESAPQGSSTAWPPPADGEDHPRPAPADDLALIVIASLGGRRAERGPQGRDRPLDGLRSWPRSCSVPWSPAAASSSGAGWRVQGELRLRVPASFAHDVRRGSAPSEYLPIRHPDHAVLGEHFDWRVSEPSPVWTRRRSRPVSGWRLGSPARGTGGRRSIAVPSCPRPEAVLESLSPPNGPNSPAAPLSSSRRRPRTTFALGRGWPTGR